MPGRKDEIGADCLVIGGGLSGLSCAHALVRAGHTVQVLETAEAVGGRARTRFHQGEPVDVGFAVLFRHYRETGEFLDEIGLTRGELRSFDRSVVVYDGQRWRRLRPSVEAARESGIATVGAAGRLLRLASRAAVAPERHLTDQADRKRAQEYLDEAGAATELVERLLRPLLGSMLLDRSLDTDAGYVQFLLGMLARGPAMLPVDGIGMIAERAATAITSAGGMIWTGVGVAGLDIDETSRAARGVVLADGRRVGARTIVVALDARTARGLLTGADPASAKRLPEEGSGVVSAMFALQRPLYEGRTVLLDAASPEGRDRVDLLCQTTNVTRPGSPGPHILIAQSTTRSWTDVDPERYVRAVGERLAAWAPGYPWSRFAQPIATYVNDWALYRIPPGVRRDLPGPRSAVTNVVLAGDAVMHPSIEGAISGGRRAARVVQSLLR